MGNKNKEITFSIKMNTEGVGTGVAKFNSEITKIMDTVKNVKAAMNNTGVSDLKRSIADINKYIETINNLGNTKQASSGFIRMGRAFEKIGNAINLTVVKFDSYSAALQGLLNIANNVGKSSSSLKLMADQAANLAAPFSELKKSISVNQLYAITEFINQTAEDADSTINLTPLADQIQRIADNSIKIALVRRSLAGIVNSLSNSSVGEVAKNLAMIGRGGGGGGFGSLERMKLGEGALGGSYIAKTEKGILDSVNNLATSEIGKNVNVAVDKWGDALLGTWNRANLEIDKYIKRLESSSDPRRVSAAKELRSAKGVAPMLSPSSTFTEESFTEITGRGNTDFNIIRGNALHAVTEEMIAKAKSMGGDIGTFLEQGMFNSKEWIDYIDRASKDIPQQLERKVRSVIDNPETGTYLDPKQSKYLSRSMTNLGNQIVTTGKGSTNLFNQMIRLVEQRYGRDTEEFSKQIKKLNVETEKFYAPLRVMEAGGRFAKGIPPDLQKLIEAKLTRLRAGLEKMGDKNALNRLNNDIEKFGLWVSGTADVVMNIGDKFVKTIDVKSGVNYDPKSASAAYQVGEYTELEAMQRGISGKDVQGYIYAPGDKARQRYGGPLVQTEKDPALIERNRIEIEQKLFAEKQMQAELLEKQVYKTKEQLKLEESRVKEAERQEAIDNRRNDELMREKDTTEKILKNREAISNVPVAAPPGGGGMRPPGGGNVISDTVLVDREKMYGGDSVSRYTDNITRATLNQDMLNQRIDLTKVKLTEVRRVINDLSTAMSKHVSVLHKGDSTYDQIAIALEKTSDLMNKYTVDSNKASKAQENLNYLQKQFARDLPNLTSNFKSEDRIFKFGFDKEGGYYGRKGDKGFGEALSTLTEHAKGMSGDNKALVTELTRYTSKYKELYSQIRLTTDENEKFKQTIREMSTLPKDATEGIGGVINKLRSLDEQFAKDILKVETLEQGFAALGLAAKRLDMNVKSSGTTVGFEKELELMKKRASFSLPEKYRTGDYKDPLKSISGDFSLKDAEINIQLSQRSKILSRLSTWHMKVSQSIDAHENMLEELSKDEKKNADEIRRVTKAYQEQIKILNRVQAEQKEYGEQQRSLSEIQRRNLGKTAEHFRATVRTTIKGFRDMMKSQMAWVAGYGIMFGTLNLFKESLMSVIEVQHQFARAMRTARSASTQKSGMLSEYLETGTDAMIKFGKDSEMIGEILYQLGSAGLFAGESLAALDTTTKMILATEGDVGETTKMVAGIYNNFKDQIISTTGVMGKFKFINDSIVSTFRDHQIEINELRDGLKHLSAMGKIANLTFTDQLGILGTLNDHLIKSGIAGRSVQSMLSKIAKTPIAFAQAFNIEIDPMMPLDLLSILKQVNKEMLKGTMSASQIGLIFDKLGLRGAKTFTTLVQHIDEVVRNIDKVKNKSVDAADEMAEIMLDKPDVAFAKMKETLAALVRIGFAPLVEAGFKASQVIAGTGIQIKKMNEATGGVISEFGKFLSLMGMTTTALWAFKAIGKKVWGPETFDGHYMRNFFSDTSKRAKKTSKEIKFLFKDIFSGIADPKGAAKVPIFLKDLTFLERAGIRARRTAKAFDRLGVALMGSAMAFKAIIAVAVVYAAIKIIDALVITNKEYLELSSNIASVVAQEANQIRSIQEQIRSYQSRNGEQDKYVKLLKEQSQLEQQQFISKLTERIKTSVDGARQAMKAYDSLEKSTKMEASGASRYGVAVFSGGVQKTREKNTKEYDEQIQSMRTFAINLNDILRSIDEFKDKDYDIWKKLDSQLELLKNKGIDLRQIYKDIDAKVKEADKTVKGSVGEATEMIANLKDIAIKENDLSIASGSWEELRNRDLMAAKQGEFYTLQNKIELAQEKITLKAQEETKDREEVAKTIDKTRKTMTKVSKLSAKEIRNIGAAKILNKALTGTYGEMRTIVKELLSLEIKRILLEERLTLQAVKQVRTLEKMKLETESFLNKTRASTFGSSALSALFTIDKETELKLKNQISSMKDQIESFETKDYRFKQLWYDRQITGDHGSAFGMSEEQLDKEFATYIRTNKYIREKAILLDAEFKKEKDLADFKLKMNTELNEAQIKSIDLQRKIGQRNDLALMVSKEDSSTFIDLAKIQHAITLMGLYNKGIQKAIDNSTDKSEKKNLNKRLELNKMILDVLERQEVAQQAYHDSAAERVTLGYDARSIRETSNSIYSISEATRTANDEFRNMEYGMAIAHSEIEVLGKISEDYRSKIEGVNNSIVQNNKLIIANEKEIKKNGEGEEEKNLKLILANEAMENANKLSAERIEWLKKEREWSLHIASINEKIANSNTLATMYKNISEYSSKFPLFGGSLKDDLSSSIDYLEEYIKETQKAESIDFYELLSEKRREAGADFKALAAAETAFEKKQYADRIIMANAYYDTLIARDNELYQAEASLAMRRAETDKETFDAVIKSVGAGFQDYYTKIENTSKAISDLTSNTMSGLTDTMAGYFTSLTMGFPEVSSEVDSLRQKLGSLDQQYSDAIGQDRLDQAAAIQNEMSKVKDEIDDLQDPLKRAGQYFEEFAEGVIKEIQKVIVQQLIMKQLAVGLGQIFNTGSNFDMNSFNYNYSTMSGASTGLDGLAEGGYVMGGIPGKDSVPILGMPGEFMIPKDSVDYYGIELMRKLQNRELERMAEGGLVGGGMDYRGNNSNSGTSVSINLENKGNSNIEATEATMSQVDPGQYIVNVVLNDVDSYGPLYQAFKGGR